ncbi:hypothetical protein IVE04_24365 [Pseudomonas mendocina]|nr:hypothetical protein [Pseudomonas mendocina]
MSAESDAQMQHFVSAVYSQNDASGADVSQVALASIESRSISFSRWKESADEAGEPGVIPERLLRHWVDADIASFRSLEGDVDAEIAADNIAANYRLYDEYCKEMQALAGDVAARVDELNAASRRRGIEQDRVSARDLVARLRDTESQRNLPADTSDLDGFTGGGSSATDSPVEPIVVRQILESITYKTQVDGSVMYLVHERPAFTDHGRHILLDKKALLDDEAILAAVLLAKEKYGGAFSLTGSEEFKRRALEVIAKNNIEVKLKSPAQEMMLREVAEKYPDYKFKPKMPMELQSTSEAEPLDQPLENASATAQSESESTTVSKALRSYAGRVLSHGAANYNNDPDENMSYFVKLETDEGEETVWGVDLKRAMSETVAGVGDIVALEFQGKQPVTVTGPDRDETGKIIGTKQIETSRNTWAVTIKQKCQVSDDSSNSDPTTIHSSDSVEDIRPVKAIHWWETQSSIINEHVADSNERSLLLQELGEKPSEDAVYWFDSAGNYVENPSIDALRSYEHKQFNKQLDSQEASQPDTREVEAIDSAINHMRDYSMSDTENKHPVLRGVAKDPETGEFETSVLLFKGKGDYLQGFIKVDGVKQQVLAHLNERKPDESTGEIKPNFIKLSKAVGQGDDTQWQELGFGNAVNKRNDGKQVYFDEVLFNVDGKTIGARVGKFVDEEMHRKLGFLEERIARPEKDKAPAEGTQDPKQKAPAATPEQAAPVETAGARAPRKPRAARA